MDSIITFLTSDFGMGVSFLLVILAFCEARYEIIEKFIHISLNKTVREILMMLMVLPAVFTLGYKFGYFLGTLLL